MLSFGYKMGESVTFLGGWWMDVVLMNSEQLHRNIAISQFGELENWRIGELAN